MSISDLSVLEHLRCAAVKLNIYKDQSSMDVDKLNEFEISTMIYHHYQDQKINDRTSSDKRKSHLEHGDNKRFKMLNELSALEILPNEIFEKIIQHLGAVDKKNLRNTCKGLYEKTNLMDKMFFEVCFNPSWQTPPDFVIQSDKTFCVYYSGKRDKDHVNSFGNFTNRYAGRISSLIIDDMEELPMKYFDAMKPDEFPLLTSLHLELVDFDNSSLLLLAPQLQHLKLFHMNCEFDLTTVTDNDRCFTKLKTLQLEDCDIDVKTILIKCSNSLQHLELDSKRTNMLHDFEHELSYLKYMDIGIDDGSQQAVRNLLSKSVRCLKTLVIFVVPEEIDFSNLLQQPLKITTFEVNDRAKDIETFLNKCPLIQNLSLFGNQDELKPVVLKDLINLELEDCNSKCITSILNQASKSLKTLRISSSEDLSDFVFPAIPKLDTLWGCVREKDYILSLDQVYQLFPDKTKVRIQVQDKRMSLTKFIRVYNL